MGVESRYLLFTLSSETFALALLDVREVLALTDITRMPLSDPHVMGVINVRGQVISLVDLRKMLGIREPSKVDPLETAIIICDLGGITVGFVVDSIDAVATSSETRSLTAQDGTVTGRSEFVSSLFERNGRLVLVLDARRLFGVAPAALPASA